MDRYRIGVFAGEIATQCRFIVAAANDAEAALARFDITDVWRHLQTILNASATLQKMFWGQGGKFTEQRGALREAFQVEDSSPLHDPIVRNDFEHVDERIESWLDEGTHPVLMSRNIGPIDGFVMGIKQDDNLHHYDPTTGLVTFRQNSISIPALVNEAVRIQGILGPLMA
jgi:hypothetical protein